MTREVRIRTFLAFVYYYRLGKAMGRTYFKVMEQWLSGFYSPGLQFSSGENPVLYLEDPDGMNWDDRLKMFDKLSVLNERCLVTLIIRR